MLRATTCSVQHVGNKRGLSPSASTLLSCAPEDPQCDGALRQVDRVPQARPLHPNDVRFQHKTRGHTSGVQGSDRGAGTHVTVILVSGVFCALSARLAPSGLAAVHSALRVDNGQHPPTCTLQPTAAAPQASGIPGDWDAQVAGTLMHITHQMTRHLATLRVWVLA